VTAVLVEGLSKSYGPARALAGIDFAVPTGARAAIVGPSGSGKTTLLRIIAGFEPADAGLVSIGGEIVVDGSAGVPAHLRGIGIVTQDGSLFPHLSVADNIGFGIAVETQDRHAEIERLMEAVELPRAMAERRPHQLSGGQQQRVALARALARRPRLMLLDEPFSALDAGLRDTMRRTVMEILRGFDVTAILVTHDQSEALSFADHLIVLRDGHLVQAGEPRALYRSPRDPDIARFLGEAVILDAELGDGWAGCVLGRVPVQASQRRGAAKILLRPEQIRMAPANSGDDATQGALGRVIDVEFGGGIGTVAIALDAHCALGPGGPGPTLLRLRIAEPDLPQPGATVAISAASPAYVFDDAARA
jgi:iron(III) transport system ATP-binding protein